MRKNEFVMKISQAVGGLFCLAALTSIPTCAGDTSSTATAGNLVESLNGFTLAHVGNVIPVHIALKPSTRSGFVDGPDPQVREDSVLRVLKVARKYPS
jgi:hypothetical protein